MSSSSSRDYADPSAPPRLCQNCAAPLRGPFCSQCGQHDIDYHRSFHHVTHDLLENVFHFEGKFFHGVAWLLACPGRLTRDFLAGRRQSQLNPLRFYLFVSVLFFLVLTLFNHGHLFNVGPEARLDFGDAQNENSTAPASPKPDGAAPTGRVTGAAKSQSGEPATPRVHTKADLGDTLTRKFKNHELTAAEVAHGFERRVPTLFFLGVPLFALLLKLFYLRSGRFYLEHLVFSLHLHTWGFLAALLGDGYGEIFGLGPPWLSSAFRWAFAFWVGAYVLLAVRAVYAQSWRKTVFKTFAVTLVYGCCLSLVAVALALGTLVWLALE